MKRDISYSFFFIELIHVQNFDSCEILIIKTNKYEQSNDFIRKFPTIYWCVCGFVCVSNCWCVCMNAKAAPSNWKYFKHPQDMKRFPIGRKNYDISFQPCGLLTVLAKAYNTIQFRLQWTNKCDCMNKRLENV